MAVFTWEFDAPDGVYKNHAMSMKLRMTSFAQTKIMGFARPEPGYGKKKGESVTITRVNALTVPSDPTFGEQDKIPVDPFSISTTAISPEQMGRAVEYSNFQEQLGEFDMVSPIQKALMIQMKLVMDIKAAAAYKACKIKAIPTGPAALTFDTDGTASTQATANIGFEHCGIIRDYLMDTIHCQPYNGSDDTFVGLGSTKLLRGIKNDPLFQNIKMYLREGSLFYNSEVGMTEGIRWVEINHTSALSNAKGLNSVLGEGLVFGDDAVALVEVLAPHLRVALAANYGLDKGVAWYGHLGFGEIWNTATDGQAKIIHITSS